MGQVFIGSFLIMLCQFRYCCVSESDWSDDNHPVAEVTPDRPLSTRASTRAMSNDQPAVYREFII